LKEKVLFQFVLLKLLTVESQMIRNFLTVFALLCLAFLTLKSILSIVFGHVCCEIFSCVMRIRYLLMSF
jgi:hypothetical protein